jgi:hypothetical protein
MNENIKEFRQEIAKLEKEQKQIKPQRKTENFKGERTIDHWTACEVAKENKHKLRIMYAAYGLMRGKTLGQIESAAKPLKAGEYYKSRYIHSSSGLDGKHPLCLYLGEINEWLEKYDFKLIYEEKTEKDWWGREKKVKKFDYENIKAIVCACEQEA